MTAATTTTARWIDNHCHIPLAESDDWLAEAHAAGVQRCLVIGTDLANSQEAIQVARKHDGVWATAGVHPHEAEHGSEGIFELLSDPQVKAIGECGLDYFYEHSPKQAQKEVFAQHIRWAHELNLALVVHTRDAWDDTFEILDREGVPHKTVFHCFTGGVPEAKLALERGIMLSFSGIVTFPKAEDVQEAASYCPLESMLVETDAPFLTPVPLRGKPNRPANVVLVGEALAAAKQQPTEKIAEFTWHNAARLYNLD